MRFYDGMSERERGLVVDMASARRRFEYHASRGHDGLALEAAREMSTIFGALNVSESEVDAATDKWLRDERMHEARAA